MMTTVARQPMATDGANVARTFMVERSAGCEFICELGVRAWGVTVVCLEMGVNLDAYFSLLAAGDEPTGHTAPYETSCGGGIRGSGAERD
jgi:hypothetical protein